jgi:S1-C subfamily serine protease
MKKNILRLLAVFIIGMAGGIFAEQIFWPYLIERPLFYKYSLEQRPIYLTEKKEVFIQENTALRDSIKKVKRAAVGVRTLMKNGEILEGSGLIMTSDGLMVTLAELVPAGQDFSFLVEGEKVPYEIIKRDPEENLALIRLGKSSLGTVSFKDSGKIEIGERVFLFGFLFDEEGRETEIVNTGIIKYIKENSINTNIFENYLLKGAPLFDIEGSALGLADIDEEGKVSAIPIDKICRFAGL